LLPRQQRQLSSLRRGRGRWGGGRHADRAGIPGTEETRRNAKNACLRSTSVESSNLELNEHISRVILPSFSFVLGSFWVRFSSLFLCFQVLLSFVPTIFHFLYFPAPALDAPIPRPVDGSGGWKPQAGGPNENRAGLRSIIYPAGPNLLPALPPDSSLSIRICQGKNVERRCGFEHLYQFATLSS